MSDKLRIRLALDTTRAEKPVLNVLTGEGPVVMHGADLRVEVILLDGAHGDDDTDVLTITDLASLTVAIMDSSREGAPLASRRTTAFTASSSRAWRIRPATVSPMACEPPRNGTCSTFRPSRRANSSLRNCPV